MRADPSAQRELLDVQRADSRLAALRHQLATLPETTELRGLVAELTRLRDWQRDVQLRLGDLAREQRKADDDVEQVKARRARDRQRLESGAGNPKDLERLQHELVSLDRRISTLEDIDLEVMERLETAQDESAAVQEQLARTEEHASVVSTARDARVSELRTEGQRVTRERAAAVAGLPGDLVALYDRLREQKDGVGAALLRGRRCQGCSLELNSSERAEIASRDPDEVVRCGECSRILVRTEESGI